MLLRSVFFNFYYAKEYFFLRHTTNRNVKKNNKIESHETLSSLLTLHNSFYQCFDRNQINTIVNVKTVTTRTIVWFSVLLEDTLT